MKASYFIFKTFMVCFCLAVSAAANGETIKFSYGGINYETINDHEVKTASGEGEKVIGTYERPEFNENNQYQTRYFITTDRLFLAGNMAQGFLEIPQAVSYAGKEYTVTAIGSNSFTYSPIYYLKLPKTVKIIEDHAFAHTNLAGMIDLRFVEDIHYYAFEDVDLNTVVVSDKFKGKDLNESSQFSSSNNINFIYASSQPDNVSDSPKLSDPELPTFDHFYSYVDESQESDTADGVFTDNGIPYKIIGGGKCKTKPGSEWIIRYKFLDFKFACTPSINYFRTEDKISDTVEADGKSYKVIEIGNRSYAYCSFLPREEKFFILPDGIKRIGSYAFYDTNLRFLQLPADLISIGAGAFAKSELYGDLNLKNINNIGEFAFAFTDLQSIVLPDNFGQTANKYGDGLFYDCKILRSIEIPSASRIIPAGTFYGCRRLMEINLPENIEFIGDLSFRNCESLTSVTLPEKVKFIGSQAFAGCSNLNEINIPPFVEEFGNFVWTECSSLEKIYYDAYNIIEASEDIFPEEIYESATLYIPTEAVEQVKNVSPWNRFVNVVDNGSSGITDIVTDTVINSGTVYNLQGMKVSDQLEGLPKGIYICNGKKIAIR